MKVCPSCNTQYTDDSLAFCLQDGTRLVQAKSGPPTAVSDETETVVRDRERSPESTNWRQTEITQISQPTGAKKSSNLMLIAAILGLVLVIVVIGGAALVWFVFLPAKTPANNMVANASTPATAINSNVVPGNANRTGAPMPAVNTNLNVALPTPTPTPSTTDPAIVRREIAGRINDWKEAAESLNVNTLMHYYADTVDYYRRGSTSAGVVRNDKQRAFSRFSSIRITISSLNVSADPSGDRATAIFDKEWVFEGARISSGKVRSQLQFKKINGDWLITGERDLSVYYVN
jgi:hypothetical protein